jgi:hypothetical protein
MMMALEGSTESDPLLDLATRRLCQNNRLEEG